MVNGRSAIITGLLVAAILLGAVSSGEARSALVTFKVTVPDDTPADADVYIAGNIDALGPWDPGKVELGKIGDRLYAISLVLEPGTTLKYKFTRGSWETVEKGPDFEELRDRELVVAGDTTVRIDVANWRDFFSGFERHSIVGDFRLHLDFRSEHLDNRRTIIVWLPPGYDEGEGRRYPVLYMHDGQNLFDAGSSFIGIEWGVDETVTRMIETEQVEPLIVVGVYNTSGRTFEYTPAPDQSRGGGGAELYAKFLIEEVKPFIDSEYRTLPGREHTGVMGSSFGGLASLYLGWKHSDVFSRIGAMSTSYLWGAGWILGMLEGQAPPRRARVWIDMGTGEDQSDRARDGVTDIIAAHRRARDILMEKGFEIGRDLAYVEDEGAIHNEGAWAARLPKALAFLFPPARKP